MSCQAKRRYILYDITFHDRSNGLKYRKLYLDIYPKDNKEYKLIIKFAEEDNICHMMEVDALIKKERAEIYKKVREGNMEIIYNYVNYLNDDNYCKDSIEFLHEIIINVPELKNKIINELFKYEEIPSLFNTKHGAVTHYILEIFKENYNESIKKNDFFEFLIKAKNSFCFKTRIKCKKLMKKYGLKV